jgi:hypothetical protein
VILAIISGEAFNSVRSSKTSMRILRVLRGIIVFSLKLKFSQAK